MSIRVMSDVWDNAEGVSGGGLLVLLALADHANQDGRCWPSVATLCQRSRLSERSVQKHLRTLELDGWIEAHQRPGRSTVYRVIVPETPVTSDTPTPVTGDTPPMLLTPVTDDTPTPVTSDTPADAAPPSPATPHPRHQRHPTPVTSDTRTVREPSVNRQDGAGRVVDTIDLDGFDEPIPARTSGTPLTGELLAWGQRQSLTDTMPRTPLEDATEAIALIVATVGTDDRARRIGGTVCVDYLLAAAGDEATDDDDRRTAIAMVLRNVSNSSPTPMLNALSEAIQWGAGLSKAHDRGLTAIVKYAVKVRQNQAGAA